MEDNLRKRTVFRIWLDDRRAQVKTLAGNIFSAPYLPARFIIFFLITNATHMAVIFMNQPLNYWTKDVGETGIAYSGTPMHTRPLDWILFGAIYLAVALFCLTVFNYRWSLIGWLTAEAIHLYGIQGWLDGCTFGRWSVPLDTFCQSFDGRLYWVICGLILGFFITSALLPFRYPIANKKVEKGLARGSAFVPAVWVVFLVSGIAFSTQKPDAYGWRPVEVEHKPEPLFEAEVAYDTTHNELVMFGGVSDYLGNGRWDFKSETWVWDGNGWFNVYPTIYPSGRVKHAMAFDENREVVVLFGGFGESGKLDDTWEWDGFTWANHCTCLHPSARYGHEMIYDPSRKKVVLYGGYDGETEFNDAWEWDGEDCTWTKIEPVGDPPDASYFSLARNPDQDYIFALLSGYPSGTWMFEDNTWTQLSLSVEPGDRIRTTTVYDPNQKQFLTFGGELEEINLNDTWLFDGESWSQYGTRTQPSMRADMVIWYDQVRKHIMLFGGRNGDAYFNDLWEFVFPEN